jgi:hypothetical protein
MKGHAGGGLAVTCAFKVRGDRKSLSQFVCLVTYPLRICDVQELAP